MELELTVVTDGTDRRDVTVQLGDGATVARLCGALGRPDLPGVWLGSGFVGAEQPVAASGIRSGVLLGLGAAAPAPDRRPAGAGIALAGRLNLWSCSPVDSTPSSIPG